MSWVIRGLKLAALGLALVCSAGGAFAGQRTSKQQSLDEWRALTSPAAEPPRVFVKGEEARFYFETREGVVGFHGEWFHLRIPTDHYRVHSALLHWDPKLSQASEGRRGWKEATVIAGLEWRQLTTNLLAELTPPEPLHGAYYQAFLADRVVYRDAQGRPR